MGPYLTSKIYVIITVRKGSPATKVLVIAVTWPFSLASSDFSFGFSSQSFHIPGVSTLHNLILKASQNTFTGNA